MHKLFEKLPIEKQEDYLKRAAGSFERAFPLKAASLPIKQHFERRYAEALAETEYLFTREDVLLPFMNRETLEEAAGELSDFWKNYNLENSLTARTSLFEIVDGTNGTFR